MGRKKHQVALAEKNFAVKIYTTALEYDYRYPWKAPTVENWTGSGFAIQGKKIITNAHVAGGAAFIEVQLANDSVKYKAKIKAIGHECDLAMLEVDNEEFWEKAWALEIGETPERKQKIEVHGFPMGGEGYCVTNGIVSRLENDTYVHGDQMLLSIQVSAAINPGNSGGAAINKEGKVVGVVHQGISRGQNIGYMIPAGVLTHFISQVDSHKMGFPTLGVETQTMENPYLREQYKMHKHHTGILVQAIAELSSASGKLKEKDIIMAIDGVRVYNDGTIHTGPMKRVGYKYLINNSKIGDTLNFTILRDGKKCTEKVTLNNTLGSTHKIMPRSFGVEPTYYIISGSLVVQPVSKNLISDLNKSFTNQQKHDSTDQLIAINTVLKSEYTQGYESYTGELIEKINGLEIHNMNDVIKAVSNEDIRLHVVEMRSGKQIVIPNLPDMLSCDILNKYQISRSCSHDLDSQITTDKMFSALNLVFEEPLSPADFGLLETAKKYTPSFSHCHARRHHAKERELVPQKSASSRLSLLR